jgi:NADH-quinone oxidoreductase subunit J
MIEIAIPELIFYLNAAILLLAALKVIHVRHPVQSALFLVLCFVAAAVLWLLASAEFLGLALIFVYVGAVMTLFLFVIMMLNISSLPKQMTYSWLTWPMLIAFMCAFLLLLSVNALHQSSALGILNKPSILHLSNTQAIGQVLYTDYALPLIITAFLLVASMIAAVALTFTGKKRGTLYQSMHQQHQATKATRLRLVDCKEQPS